MSEWMVERKYEADGFEIEIQREALSRCPDRIVTARVNGQFVMSERVYDSTWVGHCLGQLWMPRFLEKAKIALKSQHVPLPKRKVVFEFDPDESCTFEEFLRRTGTKPEDYVVVPVVKDGKPTEILIPKVYDNSTNSRAS